MDKTELATKESKDGWKWWMTTVVAIATLVVTYLGAAGVLHWWPFNSGGLAIVSPSDGYQVEAKVPFMAEASGDPGRARRVWFVGVNSRRNWYPLSEATKAASGRWTASVSPDQISGNVNLCVVAADDKATQVLNRFFQEAENDRRLNKTGLNRPEGADLKNCVGLLGPVK